MLEQKIVVTTTAMARPEIVEQTYASFLENLQGIDFKDMRLFINVDPLPDPKKRDAVVHVAHKYFGQVWCRMPGEANFSAAVNWVWKSVPDNAEYVFHLEDDWRLLEKVEIDDLLGELTSDEVIEVALRARSIGYTKLALLPSLWKAWFCRKVGGHFHEGKNPEIQLRDSMCGVELNPRRVRVWPNERDEVILEDLGRPWLSKTGMCKPKLKCDFIRWVEQ